MKPEQLVNELEQELTRIGVRVRREKGNFRGGWCTVNDERCLMINRRQSARTQFAVLAEALRTYPLDSVYLKPKIRSALEEQWSRRPVDEPFDSED